jgi:hypothetical protein
MSHVAGFETPEYTGNARGWELVYFDAVRLLRLEKTRILPRRLHWESYMVKYRNASIKQPLLPTLPYVTMAKIVLDNEAAQTKTHKDTDNFCPVVYCP